eukprot:1161245-Pelagomonas_calceolata.AAC.5
MPPLLLTRLPVQLPASWRESRVCMYVCGFEELHSISALSYSWPCDISRLGRPNFPALPDRFVRKDAPEGVHEPLFVTNPFCMMCFTAMLPVAQAGPPGLHWGTPLLEEGWRQGM